MTTFTPPTEFPHECQSISGNKITLLAVDAQGIYACLWHTPCGAAIADIQKPQNLRDLPKVTSTWQNVYSNRSPVSRHSSRSSADINKGFSRIGVLRCDTIDGVTTCTLEDI